MLRRKTYLLYILFIFSVPTFKICISKRRWIKWKFVRILQKGKKKKRKKEEVEKSWERTEERGMKIRPLITRGEKRRREKRLADLKDEEEEQRRPFVSRCTRDARPKFNSPLCSKVIRKIFHKIIVFSFATRRNWI